MSYPYHQGEHDEAADVGSVMLVLAFVPFILALVGAIWMQVVS